MPLWTGAELLGWDPFAPLAGRDTGGSHTEDGQAELRPLRRLPGPVSPFLFLAASTQPPILWGKNESSWSLRGQMGIFN